MSTALPPPLVKDMGWVDGGRFLMGSEAFYPEERPVHEVEVDGLWVDRHPVTNAQFRRFVKATGYLTVAEHAPDPADYPDADPDLLVPGALVFQPSPGPVDLRNWRNWWGWVPGADWRHPEGPGSTLHGRDLHPVVQVCHADAQAYADWAGKALPTEAEWEYAARGGLEGKVYCWGDEPTPKGRQMANTWQGEFPWRNLLLDRYERTSPVGSYPANGYGLYDMAGNVWEWTSDRFTASHDAPCCGPHDPTEAIPRNVIKGGSHLCAPSYCLRYRPAARQGEAVDTATSHIGFRCILRAAAGQPGTRAGTPGT